MKTHLLAIGLMLAGITTRSQTWLSYDQSTGLADNNVKAIAIDGAGNKWFGTYGSGISKFDGTNWTTYSVSDGLVCDFVRAIKTETNGMLWIATDGGVSKFDGISFTNYTTFQGLSNNMVYALDIDANGNKWFATNSGVSKFDNASWTVYTTANGLTNNIVTALTIDKDNNFWFGTWGGGVSKFNGTTWSAYPQANYINVIKPDSAGNLWFGTATALKRFDGLNWFSYATSNGLAADNIMAITIAKNGNIWFGTGTNGISEFNGASFTNYSNNDGLVGNGVNASVTDNAGNIWIGTSDGVSVYMPLVTHVNEVMNQSPLSVFPNPATSEIKIAATNKMEGLNYALANSTGTVIKNGKINLPVTVVEINDLPAGIYILKIDGNNSFCKIVKS